MTIIDHDKAYLEFHLRLLNAFVEYAKKQPPFNLSECSQDDQDFYRELAKLSHSEGADLLIQGQELLCRIVASYPHLMPMLPRDLLWFFGGDCLHYMPDEEILVFQQLDELRQTAKESNNPLSYEDARQKAMGLH